MKREVKKRDNKEMKKERGLREKLSRLQEEIKKCKIENEKKYESFDIMEVINNFLFIYHFIIVFHSIIFYYFLITLNIFLLFFINT